MGWWILGGLNTQHQNSSLFFSPPDQSYSRIDYFLLDRRLLLFLISTDYESIVISHHSPVILNLRYPDAVPPRPLWRLNTRLLADEEFVQFINTQIEFFLETNSSPEISYTLLWESFKTFIRGQIISYSTSRFKRNLKRLSDISDRPKSIDQCHSVSPSADLLREISLLQGEYDLLMNERHAFEITTAIF